MAANPLSWSQNHWRKKEACAASHRNLFNLAALPWLWSTQHFAKNFQVLDRELRRIKVTTARAAIPWHPTGPLRGDNHNALLVHGFLHHPLVFISHRQVVVDIERLIIPC